MYWAVISSASTLLVVALACMMLLLHMLQKAAWQECADVTF